MIYLNPDWQDDWGGFLDIAEPDLKNSKSIKPIFNRAVVFSTTDFSFHGHPDPLRCPEDVRRRSIALYYYTSERPEYELNPNYKHRISAHYKEREGEEFGEVVKHKLDKEYMNKTSQTFKEKYGEKEGHRPKRLVKFRNSINKRLSKIKSWL